MQQQISMEAVAQALSEMQMDIKAAVTALALSLHSSGHLDAKELEGRLASHLSRVGPRTAQNAGVVQALLSAATGITGNSQLHAQFAPPTVVITR